MASLEDLARGFGIKDAKGFAASVAGSPPSGVSGVGAPSGGYFSPGRPSLFNPNVRYTGDDYARNVLADEIAISSPYLIEASKRFSVPVPSLFPSGDLPITNAAGVTPAQFLAVPIWTRPHIAYADPAEAAGLLAAWTPGSRDRAAVALDAFFAYSPTPPIRDYLLRVNAWKNGWRAQIAVDSNGRQYSYMVPTDQYKPYIVGANLSSQAQPIAKQKPAPLTVNHDAAARAAGITLSADARKFLERGHL